MSLIYSYKTASVTNGRFVMREILRFRIKLVARGRPAVPGPRKPATKIPRVMGRYSTRATAKLRACRHARYTSFPPADEDEKDKDDRERLPRVLLLRRVIPMHICPLLYDDHFFSSFFPFFFLFFAILYLLYSAGALFLPVF